MQFKENRKFFIDIKNESDIITTKYRLVFEANKKYFNFKWRIFGGLNYEKYHWKGNKRKILFLF
jgi:hypothetical protein